MRISLDRLSVRFGSRVVIDGLTSDFAWDDRASFNRVIALMGPSGCGKTTLAREILRARYDGAAGTGISIDPGDAVIAYLPQDPVLFGHLSVRQNARLFESAGRYRTRFDAKQFESLAQRLRLRGLLASDASVDHLSGGEAQRLMLLRTLSVRPDLVILDEPAAGLDPAVRESFLVDLQDLLDQLDTAAVYITHHWEEVRFIAGRVAYAELGGSGEAAAIGKLDVVVTNRFEQAPPSADAFKAVYGPGCSMWPLRTAGEVACLEPPQRLEGRAHYRRGGGEYRLAEAICARLENGHGVRAVVFRVDRFVEWREIHREDLAESVE